MVDWDEVSYIIRSDYRAKILQFLDKKKSTPTQLSEELDISSSHVSRALTELREKDIVERLVESRKGRIYALTDKGCKIAEKIEEENLIDT